MDKLGIKQGFKFFIENKKYYLYEVSKDEMGDYLYAIKENAQKEINVPIENIGNMLTKYLNLDDDFFYEFIENISSLKLKSIDAYFHQLFTKLQKELNYVWAILLINKFFDYLDMSWAPNFYTKLNNNFMEKLNKISPFIKDKKIIESFDFGYVKNIDIDNFESSDILPDSITRYNVLMRYICDEQKLDKIFFECVQNNNLNILELTPYNSITNIKYTILPNLKKENPIEIYTIDELSTFLYFEMLQIQKYNINIKQCNLCGKYFIPEKDKKQKYCTNIFKNDKTCQELAFSENKKDDVIYNLYRKIYKSQHKKMTDSYIKGKEDRWQIYINDLKLQYKKCKENEISFEEFKEWGERNNNCMAYKK